MVGSKQRTGKADVDNLYFYLRTNYGARKYARGAPGPCVCRTDTSGVLLCMYMSVVGRVCSFGD